MIRLNVPYRSPYDFQKLLAFYRGRALAGVEYVTDRAYMRSVRITDEDGFAYEGFIRVEDDPESQSLIVALSDSLDPVADEIVRRVQYMFDTDRDPMEIAERLAVLRSFIQDIDVDSVTVPGSFEPFEIASRAILGQQVSVQAANKFAERIAGAFGDSIDLAEEDLEWAELFDDVESDGLRHIGRLWPSPSQILAIEDVESALGQLGVIKTRSRVIAEIARMTEEGELDLTPFPDEEDASAGSHAEQQMEKLLSIKGIGPWSANYIAMRALNHSDAFLEKDVGVIHALPDMTPKERLHAVETCRPHRSYAVLALWNSIGSAE